MHTRRSIPVAGAVPVVAFACTAAGCTAAGAATPARFAPILVLIALLGAALRWLIGRTDDE